MTDRPMKLDVTGKLVPLSDADMAQLAIDQSTAPVYLVPLTITNYQARATLINDGNFTSVDAIVRQSGSLLAVAAWDYANVFERDSPFIDLLKAASPYNTDALVDDFFVRADKVR